MSTGKIELSVGAVKIANKYELFTEEEISNIDKIPDIEDELEESVKFKVVGEGITVPPISGGGSSYIYDDTEIREMINEINTSLDNTIQLYLDKEKQIKGYPITSPDRVIDENGVNIKDEIEEINSSLDTIASLYINKSGDITSLINEFITNNTNVVINIGNGDFLCSGIDFKDRKVLIKGNGVYSNLIIDKQPLNTPGIYSNTTNKILFDNVKFTINYGISRATQPPMMFRYGNSVEFRNCVFNGTNSNDDIYTNIHIRGLKTFNFKNNEIENYKGYFIVGEGMNNGNTNIDNVSFIGNIIKSNNAYADSIFNIDNEYNKDSVINISNNIAKRDNTTLLGHAFGVGFVTNATITNNVIKNYHIGFDIDNPYRVNVNNNIVINELGDFNNSKTTIGVRIGGSSPSQSHIDNRRCKDVIVNGNYVFGYNQGISLGSDLHNTSVLNNTVENCINHIYCYKLSDSSITNNKFICSDVTTKVLRLFCINNSQINNNIFENKNNVPIVLFSVVSSDGLESNNVTINNNVNRSNIANTTIFEGLGNCSNFEVKNNSGINDISRANLNKTNVMIPNFESVYDSLKYVFTNTTMTAFVGTSIDVIPVDSSIKLITSNATITKKHTNTIIKNGAIATFDYSVTPIQECLGLTFVIKNVGTTNASVSFRGYVLNTNLIATSGTLTLTPNQKCIVHYSKGDNKVYASAV